MGVPGKELYGAAKRGGAASVRALLGQGVRADEWRDGSGWTALHVATFNGHADVSRLLIEARADVRTETHRFLTPLHFAARRHITDIARLLLHAGADVSATNVDGETPLHHATIACLDDAATLEALLLSGANLDARTNYGDTPRDLASGFDTAANFDAAVAKARRLFWTRALHPRLPSRSREVVVTVLLCLRRVATTALDANAEERREAGESAAAVQGLPKELWEMILGFAQAVCLLPKRK